MSFVLHFSLFRFVLWACVAFALGRLRSGGGFWCQRDFGFRLDGVLRVLRGSV
jgi:hypothetical protein